MADLLQRSKERKNDHLVFFFFSPSSSLSYWGKSSVERPEERERENEENCERSIASRWRRKRGRERERKECHSRFSWALQHTLKLFLDQSLFFFFPCIGDQHTDSLRRQTFIETPKNNYIAQEKKYSTQAAMSTIANKQKLVEQLRAEANIERVKISVACKDLIKFCQDHESGDVLVRGWAGFNKENPFKEKQGCVTLWLRYAVVLVYIVKYILGIFVRYFYRQWYWTDNSRLCAISNWSLNTFASLAFSHICLFYDCCVLWMIFSFVLVVVGRREGKKEAIDEDQNKGGLLLTRKNELGLFEDFLLSLRLVLVSFYDQIRHFFASLVVKPKRWVLQFPRRHWPSNANTQWCQCHLPSFVSRNGVEWFFYIERMS